MSDYRTFATIEDSGRVLLSDLPFSPGDEVEIVVRPQRNREEIVARLKKLFKETQELPHLKDLADEDIAAEIEAYRKGQ